MPVFSNPLERYLRSRSLDVYATRRFAPIEVDEDDEELNQNQEIDNFIRNQLEIENGNNQVIEEEKIIEEIPI